MSTQTHAPIQMVDTVGQYRHIQEEIDQAILDVVRSGQYINGPSVTAFRDHLSAYVEVPHTIPCANGTDALQIALMALDLQPGDEVITPTFTYVATVEVIALLRLRPVFVDADPLTFNLNPDLLESVITPRTKAIIPVHLFGQAADMAPVLAFAEKHGLHVVEDNAQAIGARYHFADGRSVRTGSIGHIGCTSFYPSKNLGAYGDGGAIFTHDAALAERLWMICNHGSLRKYYHDSIGCNSRLDSIQAAILDIKLRQLDTYTEARQWAAARYDAGFAGIDGIEVPYRAPFSTHVFHQYTLKVHGGRTRRDALQQHLKDLGIPSMVYYPVPLHLQGAYRGYGYTEGQFPVAEQLTEEVISLPMHSELTEAQVDQIVRGVTEFEV